MHVAARSLDAPCLPVHRTRTLAATEGCGGLRMRLTAPGLLGIPCPAWLRPQLVAREAGDRTAQGDRLHFRIEARVPGIEQVVGYRGHLLLPGGRDSEAASPRG